MDLIFLLLAAALFALTVGLALLCARLMEKQIMTGFVWLALVLALALGAYLVYALLNAEDF